MEPKPNRQAARSKTARDQIVQAALTVFAMKGYAATSMDDVCMAAGLSKGGLYHHFKTKSAVLGRCQSPGLQSGARRRRLRCRRLAAAAVKRSAAPIEVWAEAGKGLRLRGRLAQATKRA
jgi:AcrR family transcriptional regulator